MENKTTILVIRHVESLYNHHKKEALDKGLPKSTYRQNILLLDSPITENGKINAISLSKNYESINIKYVIVSPLRRTIQTALYLFGNHKNKPKIIVNPLLREQIS